MGAAEVWLYYFFNLITRWGWVVTLRPGRFTPGKEPSYKAGLDVLGDDKNMLTLSGFESRTVQPRLLLRSESF